ncbi:MAG TPA: hypothetical protein VGQ83_17740 [Polyangia bacterium]
MKTPGRAARAPAGGGLGPRCGHHPAAAAGWRCARCGDLCPDCAAERRAGVGTIEVCVHCGGHAPPITIPRGHVSFATRIPGAFLYPLNLMGLLAMAGLAAVLAFLPTMIGRVIGVGTFFAYIFSLITTTANGSDEITAPDFSDIVEDILTPARRGLTAGALLWVPAVVYVFWIRGVEEITFFDPVLWAIIAAGIIYLPMALLVAAAGNGVLRMLNPVFTFQCIGRLGTDYFIAVGAVAGLGILWFVTSIIAAIVGHLPIPILASWAAAIIQVYIPFVTARVLGLLLFVRGADIGYGTEKDLNEPVLPGVRPRGAVRPAAPAPAPTGGRVEEVESIALAPEPPAAPPPAEWPTGLRLEPEEPPPAVADVAQALAAGDLDRALDLYARLADDERPQLPLPSHVALGKRAAARQDFPLAVRAFRSATEVAPADPETPRAWVLLGRVYADKLGDRATAARVYEHVVEQYPGTEAAAFATAQLTPPPTAG